MLLTPQQAVLPRAPYIKRPKLATTLQAGQENNGEAEQCCLDMLGRVTKKNVREKHLESAKWFCKQDKTSLVLHMSRCALNWCCLRACEVPAASNNSCSVSNSATASAHPPCTIFCPSLAKTKSGNDLRLFLNMLGHCGAHKL